MTDLIEINDILLQHLPDVLNYIVLEYVVVEYEFQLIKTESGTLILCDYVIDSKCEYAYSYERDRLVKSKIIDNNVIVDSESMCMYNDNIYIANGASIEVFNSDCISIRKITNYCESEIQVDDGKIFGCTGDNMNDVICITDLYGKYINKINLPGKFYSMKIYDGYLYVLTYDEIIYKYSFDGDLIESYEKIYIARKHIKDFFVIDNKLYIQINCSIFDYESYNIHEINYNIIGTGLCAKFMCRNNVFRTYCGGTVSVYNVVKRNIRSLIHKNKL